MQTSDRPAAVDVATYNRAAVLMRIDVQRLDVPLGWVPGERGLPLQQRPTEIGAREVRARPVVDLLGHVPPDVTQVQITGLRVERPAPRVAQSQRVDLRLGAVVTDERVVIRNAVLEIGRAS